jgi:hypothetical protein
MTQEVVTAIGRNSKQILWAILYSNTNANTKRGFVLHIPSMLGGISPLLLNFRSANFVAVQLSMCWGKLIG